MKYLLSALFIFLIFGCDALPETEKVNVYFCGGQSNANVVWYESIKEEILKVDPTAIVIHKNHGGCGIYQWWDNQPLDNYYSDIEKIQNNIEGINYDIKGIFWYQGESDRFDGKPEKYEERFYGLMEEFKTDLNDDFPIFMTVINTADDHGIMKVREVQKLIIETDLNVFGIDSIGSDRLTLDSSHMPEYEYIRLGKEISKLAIEVLY